MSGAVFEFGDFHLDLAARRLLRGKDLIPITVKAFDTLAALVERAGTVVDKDDLMRQVWPDTIVEDSNLSQQIFVLRKALGEHPTEHRYIQTVPRRGYRFIAPVTRHEIADGAAGPSTSARDARPLRLSLLLPSDAPLALGASPPFALSPDGMTLAYVARIGGGSALHIRRLDEEDPVRIDRTDGACSPFFSADGKWIGYFAHNRMWKVAAAGGPPATICQASVEARGAAWSANDEIIFAPTPASGLSIVRAERGVPSPLTTIDFANGERSHRWPALLPGGRHVLYTLARAGSASFDEAEIVIAGLDGSRPRTIVRHGSGARYVPSGHLVYMRGGSMMAVAFDLDAQNIVGTPAPLLTHVMTQPTGAGYFDFSQSGRLVYLTGDAHDVKRELVRVSARGEVTPIGIGDLAIEEPRLSPDRGRIAFGVRGARNEIWIHDFESGASTRVTFEGDSFAPIWTPDGKRLTFSSNRNGPCHIFSQDAGAGEPLLLVGGDYDLVPGSWSRDGLSLLFTEYSPRTGASIFVYDAASQSIRALVHTSSNEFGPALAPDGRSFAYTSDESGRFEVYLAPFPEFGAKTQISVGGGAEPLWSPDGRQVYYRNGPGVMRAEIDGSSRQRIGAPQRIAEGPYQPGAVAGLPNYDVAGDGSLLMIAQAAAQAQPDRLSIVINWFADICERLA
jgi:DNA-binding winged helix-turn-helix (wHTH) protein/Tol biopolymer transport system component